MNTNIFTKTLIITLLFALLLSACGKVPDKKSAATMESVISTAQEALDELTRKAAPEAYATELWAINAVVAVQPGAFAYLNELKGIAVFMAPAGQTAEGVTYYLSAWINTTHVYIMDGSRAMVDLGINPAKIVTLDDITEALRARGFTQLTEVSAPTLIATLRLAMGLLKSKGAQVIAGVAAVGGYISDFIVIATYGMTPELLYPWCEDGACVTIEQ